MILPALLEVALEFCLVWLKTEKEKKIWFSQSGTINRSTYSWIVLPKLHASRSSKGEAVIESFIKKIAED